MTKFYKIRDKDYANFRKTIPIDDGKNEMEELKKQKLQFQIARLQNPPERIQQQQQSHQNELTSFSESDDEEENGEIITYNSAVTAEGEDEYNF